MDRSKQLASLNEQSWDIIVIGGGACGLGTAVDAASRGYRTLLLEQSDFAQATSSRSTKLIHGGVRYLQQGNFSLVRESLQERALLLQNAPHLVHIQPFILPSYSPLSRFYYFAGLKLYDFLAGKKNIQNSSLLSKKTIIKYLPTINPTHLFGGVHYFDGKFDDARLAINLAQTVIDHGGTALNYMKVKSFIKSEGKLVGVIATDTLSQNAYALKASVIINATGAFVDSVRRLDEKNAQSSLIPSQGTHIVLDRSFLPGDQALIIPQPKEDRVLFAIPWHSQLLVGTTDVSISDIALEPKPQQQEINYLLSSISKYLTKHPTESDILSTFAGIRSLAKPSSKWNKTSELQRDYFINVSDSNLISIVGGKWTTYRKIGESAIDTAIGVGGLDFLPSNTSQLKIHGWHLETEASNEWDYYGSDLSSLEKLIQQNPGIQKKLNVNLPCREVDVIWAVRNEMAQRLEDVLSRRTRCLLINAKATLEIAPKVVEIMAREMNQNKEWQQKELEDFKQLAKGYLLTSPVLKS